MKTTTIALTLSLLIYSCGDDKNYKLSSEQLYTRANSAAIDNNEIITSAEEIIDLTADVLADEGISSGRISGRQSDLSARPCRPSIDHSYLIDRTHYDTTLYIGTMTIDYQNGETCENEAAARSGKIIDDFEYIVNNKNEIFWSKETITFASFKKDSVKIDGEFMIYSKSGSPTTLQTSNAVITYADGKTAHWKGTLNFAQIRKDGHAQRNTITGTMNGVTRRLEEFETIITDPIEYNYDCESLSNPVPVKGTMLMEVNHENSSVNYGNGSCDNIYILTIEDKQMQHEL